MTHTVTTISHNSPITIIPHNSSTIDFQGIEQAYQDITEQDYLEAAEEAKNDFYANANVYRIDANLSIDFTQTIQEISPEEALSNELFCESNIEQIAVTLKSGRVVYIDPAHLIMTVHHID